MESRPSGKRVLIADDYPDMAESIAELILMASPTPIEVALAFDGGQAVEMTLATLPDCVILDIDMPVKSGTEAAVEIRARLGPRAPLLVALTGDPGHWSTTEVRTAFDHFLVKPPTLATLLALIAGADIAS